MEKIGVLLASPNDGILQSLRKLLEQDNEIELVGSSGTKAGTLELSRTLEPQVVVIDFDMFNENFDIDKQILKTNPDTRIIVLSLFDFVGRFNVKAALQKEEPEASSVNWLSKRSNPTELLNMIAKVGGER